ncbi:methylated-DNA-[protein]-cysteine S-methyltransferase [Gillisia sp. Hel1_33_143]|uniref:methylated-DNA--[protein]-cysteine S-methyltransferase n=1 Tax=Gillisia sp. Hel1_33_143 TaxID=1336796 RepID=UPI00087CCFA2|nr:methylated-DNA--[protein]-cysteine S-methyltransferase [Gillisia sp. Hel1_33_143]SDR90267.1 methylated-DNA-[protein]-cysteine S-methyltransferase [Gillisia sp. Hel1_33_143]
MNAFLKTPLGICEVTGDIDGITSIKILDTDKEISQHIPEILVPATTQLKAYFNGELQEFTFRINPQGTSFQKQVWEALLKIPYGETRSYLQLSKELGNVKAVRAVAAANGKNPLWIAVPCHRVIGSDGALTGYAGGLWRKKWLLELEKPSLQQELF